MGLFVTEKDNFDIEVKYVFTPSGVPVVFTNEMQENLNKPEEEKKEFASGIRQEMEKQVVKPGEDFDYMSIKTEDIKKIKMTFRKPNFSDVPVILGNVGEEASSLNDLLNFNTRRINVLFVKGKGEDHDGKEIIFDLTNIRELHPALGFAIVGEMNQITGINT